MITLLESKCDYVKDDEAASKRIALLESELASKDARIAELEQRCDEAISAAKVGDTLHREALARAEKAERERDEERREVVALRLERCENSVGFLTTREASKRLANQGPGTGAHLFPKESEAERAQLEEVEGLRRSADETCGPPLPGEKPE